MADIAKNSPQALSNETSAIQASTLEASAHWALSLLLVGTLLFLALYALFSSIYPPLQ